MRCRWLAGGLVFGFGAACAMAAATASARPAKTVTSARVATSKAPPLMRQPIVALTFDDLPAAGGLPPDESRTEIAAKLAHELRANHLEGTYGFVTAEDLQGDPDSQEALRVWVNTGMKIGNHTWSHPSLTSDTAAEFESNIARDEPALREYSEGQDWHWFRFPYLEEGDTLRKRDNVRDWLRERGYRVAEVTLNFQDDDWDDAYDRCVAKHNRAELDWLQRSYIQNAAEFIQLGREEEQIAFGHEIPNVLLLHETAFTTMMFPQLLHLLRQEGFRFEPLTEVERNPAYAMDPNAGLPNGGTLPNEFMNARHLKYPPFKPEPVQRLNSVCE